MVFGSNQTFEPRTGTAQLIFGVIYALITLTALMLALYTRQQQEAEPWLHYCMAFIFALMAIKSFVIHARVKALLKGGVYYEAKVNSCEAKRGITVITGTCDVKDYGLIHIESRLVGETVAHEINRYMQEHKQESLPALVVGANTNKPRGMFTVKCLHGHLIEDSARLQPPETTAQAPEQEQATPTSPAQSKVLDDELAAIAKTKQEQEQLGAAQVEQAELNKAQEKEQAEQSENPEQTEQTALSEQAESKESSKQA